MAIARRYSPLDITVQPGTPVDTPLHVDWNIGDVWLYEIDLRIPPGHGGQTGIRFVLGYSQVVPWDESTSWINGNDDTLSFDVEEEVGNGLDIYAYNLGIWPHSFYLRFVNVPIAGSSSPIVVPTGLVTPAPIS